MNGTNGLFESLPAQDAPVPESKACPRLRTAERHQIEFRPTCIDDLVPEDHRVRLLWTFVQSLNLAAILSGIKAVEGRPGRPAADPQILVALWLYATVEGIVSAREVARLCNDHLAFRWLCGGVGMNAKTLADFRVGHGEALERLLINSFAALMKAGVAHLDRVAQDGVRVRASAGAASFRRQPTLEECLAEAAKRVRELQAEAEKDPGASERRRAAAQKRGAEDRERRVKEALAVTGELAAKQQEKARREADRASKTEEKKGTEKPKKKKKKKEKEAEPRASTTDTNARVMKLEVSTTEAPIDPTRRMASKRVRQRESRTACSALVPHVTAVPSSAAAGRIAYTSAWMSAMEPSTGSSPDACCPNHLHRIATKPQRVQSAGDGLEPGSGSSAGEPPASDEEKSALIAGA